MRLELFSRSTDRLARQNRIREAIGKSTARPNISAFAREFGVARRTIIRDLQELIRRGQLKPEVYPEWEKIPTLRSRRKDFENIEHSTANVGMHFLHFHSVFDVRCSAFNVKRFSGIPFKQRKQFSNAGRDALPRVRRTARITESRPEPSTIAERIYPYGISMFSVPSFDVRCSTSPSLSPEKRASA